MSIFAAFLITISDIGDLVLTFVRGDFPLKLSNNDPSAVFG